MSASDGIVSFIVALLLIQAVRRIPSALRGRHRERPLWGAFTTFAVAWWLRTDAGRAVIDPLGVNDLPTLIKHVMAIVGVRFLLNYVTAVYDDEDAAARHIRITTMVHRLAGRAALATVICLAGLFFFALDRTKTGADSPYFIGRHIGEPGLVLYMGLLYLYIAVVAAACGYQWGRAARHAHHWPLRIGLAMMTAGMALIITYTAVRSAFLIPTYIHATTAPAVAEQEHITDTLLYSGFLLWLIGSITPATRALIKRSRCLRAIIRLHPLWRDLVLAVDGIALYKPSLLFEGRRATGVNRVRDVLSHDATVQIRLGRYVTEIRDVTHELRRRAPADLLPRARRLAESQGHRGSDAAVVAEAYWLKAALDAIDHPAGAPVTFETTGDDFASEVAWLTRVADAYRKARPTAALLIGTPAEQPLLQPARM